MLKLAKQIKDDYTFKKSAGIRTDKSLYACQNLEGTITIIDQLEIFTDYIEGGYKLLYNYLDLVELVYNMKLLNSDWGEDPFYQSGTPHEPTCEKAPKDAKALVEYEGYKIYNRLLAGENYYGITDGKIAIEASIGGWEKMVINRSRMLENRYRVINTDMKSW